jgi:flagellar protein FliS
MTNTLKKNFLNAYKTTAVESAVTEATPHRLMELLYAGVIKNLKLANIFIEQKNYEKKSHHLNKSLAILSSLKSGVSEYETNEVTVNLSALYDYCYRQVFAASVENNTVKIDEVIQLIEPVSQAWQQMPENLKRASREQLEKLVVTE